MKQLMEKTAPEKLLKVKGDYYSNLLLDFIMKLAGKKLKIPKI